MKTYRVKMFLLSLLCISFFSCEEDGITRGETIRIFDQGIPIRVAPDGTNSTFSYYNTSPESPDGEMLFYVKILTQQLERNTPLDGELRVTTTDLTEDRLVAELQNFRVHNGVNAQWLDNDRIAYYTDGKIHIANLAGQQLITPFEAFSIGHSPFEDKILYTAISPETDLYTIYEYNTLSNEHREIADANTFIDITDQFPISNPRPMDDRRIRHPKYSPDGSKIAFRIDIGDGEIDNHLVTMNIDGGDIIYFGPKPMHFAWFDNETMMGHDNQIDDGQPNDRSARRWTLDGEFIETLAGEGNHLSVTEDRELYATESWYNENPVILRVYRKGITTPVLQINVSTDSQTVWELGNHVNPAFSRDGRRLYFHNNQGLGVSQAFMIELPDNL
jgi:Tol biopolymer transport system component